MKIRKRNKNRMKYAPMHRGLNTQRKGAIYYTDWCCRECYFDWGHGWERRQMYTHDCTESNYLGLLKKYWKSSKPDYFGDFERLDGIVFSSIINT
mgnify:CR=1 FL=1